MAFIKVNKYLEDKVAYINVDHIVSIIPNGKTAELVLTDKIKCRVKESAETILDSIKPNLDEIVKEINKLRDDVRSLRIHPSRTF
jgi:ribonuclease PH